MSCQSTSTTRISATLPRYYLAFDAKHCHLMLNIVKLEDAEKVMPVPECKKGLPYKFNTYDEVVLSSPKHIHLSSLSGTAL